MPALLIFFGVCRICFCWNRLKLLICGLTVLNESHAWIRLLQAFWESAALRDELNGRFYLSLISLAGWATALLIRRDLDWCSFSVFSLRCARHGLWSAARALGPASLQAAAGVGQWIWLHCCSVRSVQLYFFSLSLKSGVITLCQATQG